MYNKVNPYLLPSPAQTILHRGDFSPLEEFPLFSVLVASFNNGRHLETMVESVLCQTWPHWELIIAEDGSTDCSEDVLELWKHDPRVHIIKHPRNLGVGAAFRTAATHAKGSVLGMLGADDALMPNALEHMILMHKAHLNASLVNSLVIACNQNLEPLGPFTESRNLLPGESLIRNPVVGSFAAFKREAYERTSGFNPNFKKAVDHDLYLKLDEVGDIVGTNEYLYHYRLHEGGISQGSAGHQAFSYSILARYHAHVRRQGSDLDNLSRSQIKELLIQWHLIKAFPLRRVDHKTCNAILLSGFKVSTRLAFKSDFWSIWIRNNLIGI